MKIYGSNGVSPGSPASSRKTRSSGFTLGEASTTQQTRAAAAPRAAGGIEALLAMQGVDDGAERRRRSVVHGRNALDLLDDLKIGLLSGELDAALVTRLRNAAVDLKSTSGDSNLDRILSEIELRVEVELAKTGQ